MFLCGNKANEAVVKVYSVLSTVYARQLISVIISYALANDQECDVQMSGVLSTLSREVHCGQMQFFVGCLFGLACSGALCILFLRRNF